MYITIVVILRAKQQLWTTCLTMEDAWSLVESLHGLQNLRIDYMQVHCVRDDERDQFVDWTCLWTACTADIFQFAACDLRCTEWKNTNGQLSSLVLCRPLFFHPVPRDITLPVVRDGPFQMTVWLRWLFRVTMTMLGRLTFRDIAAPVCPIQCRQAISMVSIHVCVCVSV